jgi:hypothetical protein
MFLLVPEIRLSYFSFKFLYLFALGIKVKDTSSALPAFH